MASAFSSSTTTSFLLHKTPQLSTLKKQTTTKHVSCTRISCNANPNTTNNNNEYTPIKSDRRNILIGIAGLSACGTALSLEGWPAEAQARETAKFPLPLDSVIRTNIPRPRKNRSKSDKEDEEEVIDIKFQVGKAKSYIAFDVYVNDYDEHQVGEKTDIKTQYAGSFTSLGQKEGDSVGVDSGKRKKSSLKLAISRLLEDIGASDDETIDVTIVPNAGAAESVVISDVGIEFASA